MKTSIFEDTYINCFIETINMEPHFVIRSKSSKTDYERVVAFGRTKNFHSVPNGVTLLCLCLQQFSEIGGKVVPPHKGATTMLFSKEDVHKGSFSQYLSSYWKIKKAVKQAREADMSALRGSYGFLNS